MYEIPRSPKRRRILTSLNRPAADDHDDLDDIQKDKSSHRRHADRNHVGDNNHHHARRQEIDDQDDQGVLPTQEQLDEHEREQNDPSYRPSPPPPPSPHPKVTKIRFKSSSSKSSRSRRRHRDGHGDNDDGNHHHSHHRHRSRSRSPRRSHKSHGSHRRRSKSPAQKQDPFAPAPLSPTSAFRESLFDAMADDEGAAYWEAVYGQPIHIYPPPANNPGQSSSSGGGTGQGHLEQMTDDEYAEYVRQKMWEKTHAGLLEARARREKEKQKQRAEEDKRRTERARLEREMERSLAKGEERRRRRRWEAYVRGWEEWDGLNIEKIPWPDGIQEEEKDEKDEGGRVGEVKKFFEMGIEGEEGLDGKIARLKEERVRWHPDKMQQRFPGGKVDGKVMRDVTAVFQVVDGLLGELRKKRG